MVIAPWGCTKGVLLSLRRFKSAGRMSSCRGAGRSSTTLCAGPRGAGTASRCQSSSGVRNGLVRGSHLTFVIRFAYSVFAALTFRPKVVLALVWTTTHFQCLLAWEHELQAWLLSCYVVLHVVETSFFLVLYNVLRWKKASLKMRIRSPGLGGAEAEAVLEMRASTMAYDLTGFRRCFRLHSM